MVKRRSAKSSGSHVIENKTSSRPKRILAVSYKRLPTFANLKTTLARKSRAHVFPRKARGQEVSAPRRSARLASDTYSVRVQYGTREQKQNDLASSSGSDTKIRVPHATNISSTRNKVIKKNIKRASLVNVKPVRSQTVVAGRAIRKNGAYLSARAVKTAKKSNKCSSLPDMSVTLRRRNVKKVASTKGCTKSNRYRRSSLSDVIAMNGRKTITKRKACKKNTVRLLVDDDTTTTLAENKKESANRITYESLAENVTKECREEYRLRMSNARVYNNFSTVIYSRVGVRDTVIPTTGECSMRHRRSEDMETGVDDLYDNCERLYQHMVSY